MRSLAQPVRFGNAIAVCLTALLLAACEYSKSCPTCPSKTCPTCPSETCPTCPTPEPSSSVVFEFDEGITVQDRATLINSVSMTTNYFQRQFGRAILSPLTVVVHNTDGPFALAQPGGQRTVYVYVQNRGWRIVGPMAHTKMMVHELFEILQEEINWPAPDGSWNQEGSAEFLGDAIAIDAGMATIDEVRQCRIWSYFAEGGPSTAPLEELLDFNVITPGGEYQVSWLAWDRLLGGPAGTPKIRTYWSSHSFETAFGRTEQSFYQEFAAYRAALQQPSGDVCYSLDTR